MKHDSSNCILKWSLDDGFFRKNMEGCMVQNGFLKNQTLIIMDNGKGACLYPYT